MLSQRLLRDPTLPRPGVQPPGQGAREARGADAAAPGRQGGGVGRPCAAALDADALDAVLRNASKWDGTRALLRDVWRGHKEEPRKARAGRPYRARPALVGGRAARRRPRRACQGPA